MDEFFCTIGNKLIESSSEKPNPLLSDKLGDPEKIFSFKVVSETNVINVVKKMKTTHGSGCDGVASFFIKVALPLLSGS